MSIVGIQLGHYKVLLQKKHHKVVINQSVYFNNLTFSTSRPQYQDIKCEDMDLI